MHIPDGFIDAPVAAASGVVAVAAVAVSLRGARREVSEASAPLAGLTAVFVFAAQMVNFPVGAGTSGHLIGAALAAILIGPYAAVLAMTVVITIQALVFADGGLTALGLNIVNMAVVATVVGWLVFRLGTRVLPRVRWSALLAAGIAGFGSVVASAAAFSLEFALGGTAPIPAGTVTIAMLAVHAVIGVGEGVITALVVGAVLSVRPDLVFGLRDRLMTPELEPRESQPAQVGG